jgi:hypothetical protein
MNSNYFAMSNEWTPNPHPMETLGEVFFFLYPVERTGLMHINTNTGEITSLYSREATVPTQDDNTFGANFELDLQNNRDIECSVCFETVPDIAMNYVHNNTHEVCGRCKDEISSPDGTLMCPLCRRVIAT